MNFWEIILSLVLNGLPVIILIFPWFLLKNKPFLKTLYVRFYWGFVLFYVIYWILPSLLELNVHHLNEENMSEKSSYLGIIYIFMRGISMVLSYFQYSFHLLPFIFIISPIISILIIMSRLKMRKKNSFKEIFKHLNYELQGSPKEFIIKSFKEEGWKSEVQIFKSFLILLPISLYLIGIVLDIVDIDALNFNANSTALGWFFEIFFVYIATFLLGYQLIKSSKISYQGRFFGEQIQNRFFTSLKQIGTPISILSIILFIVQTPDRLLIIIYFFGYFLMAIFIFIINLRIFEPVSIYLLLKIINSIKWILNRNISIKSLKLSKDHLQKKSYLNVITNALLAGTLILLVYLIFYVISGEIIKNKLNSNDIYEIGLIGTDLEISQVLFIELLVSLFSIEVILRILIFAYFYSQSLKSDVKQLYIFLIFSSIHLTITFFVSLFLEIPLVCPLYLVSDEVWITGIPIITTVFGFDFLTLRTAFLYAEFSNVAVLRILTAPFIILRPFCNSILWGYLFFLIKKRFIVKSFENEDNLVEKLTYSNIDPKNIAQLITKHPESLIIYDPLLGFDENCKDPNRLHEILLACPTIHVRDLHSSLKDEFSQYIPHLIKLHDNHSLSLWNPEFSCLFERTQLDTLYVLYPDGRNLFYYDFNPENPLPIEPFLVSGMFSAISAFVKETTRSTELLRAIDCGDKKVLLEYMDKVPVFVAVFANQEIAPLRQAMKIFLKDFVDRHKKELKHWIGDILPFQEDHDLVRKDFIDFI